MTRVIERWARIDANYRLIAPAGGNPAVPEWGDTIGAGAAADFCEATAAAEHGQLLGPGRGGQSSRHESDGHNQTEHGHESRLQCQKFEVFKLNCELVKSQTVVEFC